MQYTFSSSDSSDPGGDGRILLDGLHMYLKLVWAPRSKEFLSHEKIKRLITLSETKIAPETSKDEFLRPIFRSFCC